MGKDLVFRDLRADEIEVRVNQVIDTADFKGCTLLLYKNARVDMDILDEVVSPTGWKREHSRDNANCTVSIWDDEKNQWIGKEDTGTESNTEAEKGLASDSFKRACVNWGIGRKLYTRLNLKVECKFNNKGKPAGSWYVEDIRYDDKKITGIRIIYDYYGRRSVAFDSIAENHSAGAVSTEMITDDQKAEFARLGIVVANTLRKFNVESVDELTKSQADWVIAAKKKYDGAGAKE